MKLVLLFCLAVFCAGNVCFQYASTMLAFKYMDHIRNGNMTSHEGYPFFGCSVPIINPKGGRLSSSIKSIKVFITTYIHPNSSLSIYCSDTKPKKNRVYIQDYQTLNTEMSLDVGNKEYVETFFDADFARKIYHDQKTLHVINRYEKDARLIIGEKDINRHPLSKKGEHSLCFMFS